MKKVEHYMFIRTYTLYILGQKGKISQEYLENLVSDFFLKFQENEIGLEGRVLIQERKFQVALEQIKINTNL